MIMMFAPTCLILYVMSYSCLFLRRVFYYILTHVFHHFILLQQQEVLEDPL